MCFFGWRIDVSHSCGFKRLFPACKLLSTRMPLPQKSYFQIKIVSNERVTKSFERVDVSSERVTKPFERADVSSERVTKTFERLSNGL